MEVDRLLWRAGTQRTEQHARPRWMPALQGVRIAQDSPVGHDVEGAIAVIDLVVPVLHGTGPVGAGQGDGACLPVDVLAAVRAVS